MDIGPLRKHVQRPLLYRSADLDGTPSWRQAIGDLRFEIEAIIVSPKSLPAAVAAAPQRPLWKRAIPVAVAAVTEAVGLGVSGSQAKEPSAECDAPERTPAGMRAVPAVAFIPVPGGVFQCPPFSLRAR